MRGVGKTPLLFHCKIITVSFLNQVLLHETETENTTALCYSVSGGRDLNTHCGRYYMSCVIAELLITKQ